MVGVTHVNSNLKVNEVVVPMSITGTNVNWRLGMSITLDGTIYKATQVKCTSSNYANINGTKITQNNTLDVSDLSELYATSAGASYTAVIEITYTKQK